MRDQLGVKNQTSTDLFFEANAVLRVLDTLASYTKRLYAAD